jgi:glucan phosphoethanolaminetransferase (alkaline phosphatase superfamily)
MNRRDFIKLAGAAGVATTGEPPVLAYSQAAKAGPRQAIVILGESVRYDMLSCNANTGLKTPNLDRIAAQGVRFERAYNCQPVCAPARSAIWT